MSGEGINHVKCDSKEFGILFLDQHIGWIMAFVVSGVERLTVDSANVSLLEELD